RLTRREDGLRRPHDVRPDEARPEGARRVSLSRNDVSVWGDAVHWDRHRAAGRVHAASWRFDFDRRASDRDAVEYRGRLIARSTPTQGGSGRPRRPSGAKGAPSLVTLVPAVIRRVQKDERVAREPLANDRHDVARSNEPRVRIPDAILVLKPAGAKPS